MNLLKVRVPIAYSFLFLAAGAGITFLMLTGAKSESNIAAHLDTTAAANGKDCSYSIARLKGFSYIKPLVLEQPECESKDMAALKSELMTSIGGLQQQNIVSQASVFVQDMMTEDWIDINNGLTFHPGSLMKVPLMLGILKMAESNPAFLDKKIVTSNKPYVELKQTFNSKTLEPGKTYTIKELLHYMIAYSDNYATELLAQQADMGLIDRLFADLGLTIPGKNAEYFKFTISAMSFSKLLSVIYNAGYITAAQSSLAAELLAECDFKEGIVKGLPQGVRLIHKFGEAGRPGEHELHETAIVYLNSRSYLITVMTSGKDIKQLAGALSTLSATTYKYFKKDDI